MTQNIVWQNFEIGREEREKIIGYRSFLLWYTGLSGSGKSTLATEIQKKLILEKKLVYILDGDNIRHGLNSDLGFSSEDRKENIRRIGEVSKLFVDSGMITIASFISPYKEDRDQVRDKLGNDFLEVYVKCSLEECEKRDPKGLYKQARNGYIKEFTGISAPYESPVNPEITVDTSILNIEKSVNTIYSNLKDRWLI